MGHQRILSQASLIIACITAISLVFNLTGAFADTVGSTGSVTLTKHLTAASRAFAARDYKTARDEYRIAIGLSPETLEFYYGLYDVCVHSNEWDQVVFALEKIFEIDPSKKKQLGAQYGEALYHLNRYDEAVPVLKQALKDADLPRPKIALVVPPPPAPSEPPPALTPNNNIAVIQAPAFPVKPIRSDEPNVVLDVSEGLLGGFSKTFETAVRSECILLAEYRGYVPCEDITYYHPPQANYRIIKILKGPPLNRDIPIRYEFHDRSKAPPPPAWKFGPDKMPQLGSQWIIFIMNAVPRDGMFDTYQGSFGRQPADEDNLNKVYALLENAANR